jgi:acetylornithine deacetylase/succinyl-diaminopimelate desuccinylase-like protein
MKPNGSAQKVLDRINADELVKLALDLANIDSPSGSEGEVAQYVYDWLLRHGFVPQKLGLLPDRFNVVATLPGQDYGRSLIFNSHLDTTIAKEEIWTTRRAADPIFHSAWREGDVLVGNGICNDKGPMAAWLTAANAIRETGAALKGDLILTAVVGEIGLEPVDEFQPPEYTAKEAGARYAVTHGAVGDYALVAEGTDLGLVWVEAGKAFFKITIFGDDFPIYTPYITRPTPIEKSPNAIVRMARLIERLEEWAYDYERRHRYECPGGVVVPKANIGAIRGGVPYKITKTVQQCAIYVDVRITPIQNPLDVREELRRLVAGAGLSGEVELYVYRRAYEGQRVEPLAEAVRRSHQQIFGETPKVGAPHFASMWRDINVFNEMGIPSLTYGPGASVGGGNLAMRIADLVTAAKLYALIALDLCNQERTTA